MRHSSSTGSISASISSVRAISPASTWTCLRIASTPSCPTAPDAVAAAQFVLSRLHEVLTLLLAPIITHTADELWEFLPDRDGKPASVHLAEFPRPDPRWEDATREARWQHYRGLRDQAPGRALEGMRKAKLIGSSQGSHDPPEYRLRGRRGASKTSTLACWRPPVHRSPTCRSLSMAILHHRPGRPRRRSPDRREGRRLQVRSVLEPQIHRRPGCRIPNAPADRLRARVIQTLQAS